MNSVGEKSRKIFVGGLKPCMKEAGLIHYFSRFGEVQRAVIVYDKHTRRSRGFGFVVMSEKAAAEAVLKVEHTLEGVHIDCKQATFKEKTHEKNRKLFVGGLMPSVTHKEFTQYFAQFGIIQDSVVMRNKANGKPRGFGFVTFTSQEAIDKVIANYPHNFLAGKWVECKRATPKDLINQSYVETEDSSEFRFSDLPADDPEQLCISLVEEILGEE